MIEFKDGKKSVKVSYVLDDACVVLRSDRLRSQAIYLDKDLYHLLQQAMPHIGAIVEGDAPEIFPGTNEALGKLGVRKE